jgi:uncharacterized protein (TIGR04255 family)
MPSPFVLVRVGASEGNADRSLSRDQRLRRWLAACQNQFVHAALPGQAQHANSSEHARLTAEESLRQPKLASKGLNVPHVESVTYSRNFLKTAVCELRFPTVFELEEPRPPVSFWKAIKHDFPQHDLLNNINVGPATVAQGRVHQFRSRKALWTVTLRASAITVETQQYVSFELFRKQVSVVLKAAEGIIDSDMFTRVGLRYINVIPLRRDLPFSQIINQELILPLARGVFGAPEEYWQSVRGTVESGKYLFQHGLSTDPNNTIGYALDFDFSAEEVLVSDVMRKLESLHSAQVDFFHWSLGPATREALSNPATRS